MFLIVYLFIVTGEKIAPPGSIAGGGYGTEDLLGGLKKGVNKLNTVNGGTRNVLILINGLSSGLKRGATMTEPGTPKYEHAELKAWRSLADTIIGLDALYEGKDLVVADLAQRARAIKKGRR